MPEAEEYLKIHHDHFSKYTSRIFADHKQHITYAAADTSWNNLITNKLITNTRKT
jgi:hypothetical protein